ncbi:MAG: hypothetical protein WBX15_12585 [Thermoanaerobaculia bacterium]
MRFRIEQLFLTDEAGRAAPSVLPRFFMLEATSPEDAVDKFLEAEQSSLIGDLQRYPGLQVVATGRREQQLFTLEVAPVSDHGPSMPREQK